MYKTFLLALAILLTACSGGIDGTFSDNGGFTQYRFQPDGKVYSRTLGMEVEMQYEMDGNSIRLKGPAGVNLILEKQDSNTIIGPLGTKLVRKT